MFQRNHNASHPQPTICLMPELTRQLFEIENLLKQKYQNISVTVTFGKGKVKISLLNGRNGMDEGIDEENERPIKFLESFGEKATKEEAEHSYWSYSVVKFDESQLQPVIDGLKILQNSNPNPEGGFGKMIRRC